VTLNSIFFSKYENKEERIYGKLHIVNNPNTPIITIFDENNNLITDKQGITSEELQKLMIMKGYKLPCQVIMKSNEIDTIHIRKTIIEN
jgi:hypothetical protein